MNDTCSISITGGLKFLLLIFEYLHDIISMVKTGNFVWNADVMVIVSIIGIIFLWVLFDYYKK
jgi:hypothetical protein